MHLIAYVSTCLVQPEHVDIEIEKIRKSAKETNSELDITGVLFFHDGQFLQIIEGEEENLHKLMEKIESDPRHISIEYLIDKPVKERGFSNWRMDSFKLGAGQKFDSEILKNITRCYDSSLLPGGDKLVFFYKALLEEKDLAI